MTPFDLLVVVTVMAIGVAILSFFIACYASREAHRAREILQVREDRYEELRREMTEGRVNGAKLLACLEAAHAILDETLYPDDQEENKP